MRRPGGDSAEAAVAVSTAEETPVQREDRPSLSAGIMVGALCLLSLQDSLVKLASSDISLWQFQLLRSICNLSLLLVFARFFWGGRPEAPKRFWAVALRSFFLVCAMILFFGGAPFLNMSDIAAGIYVFPLFVTILSVVFLGERVGPRRILAVVAGFTGTLLILKPGTESFQWVGLMPVGAGLCYAAMILTTRKLCRDERPATLTAGISVSLILVGSLGIGLTALLQPGELAVQWPYLFTGWHELVPWVIGIILACSGLNLIANVGLAKAYQNAESSWLAPFDYSYLIFSTIWGVVIWNYFPDALALLGMAMIAASGCYVAWRERQESLKAKTN